MKRVTLFLMASLLLGFSHVEAVTDKLMVVGEAVWGGWSPDNAAVMVQNTDNPTVFVYTGWLEADKEFKFLTQAEWNKDEYRNNGSEYLNGAGTLRLNGDDTKFKVSEAGNYKITCNLTDLTVTAEKIAYQTQPIHHNVLYLVGTATPGEWNLGESPKLVQDTENPFVFSAAIDLKPGTFKIPVNKYAGYGQKFYYRNADNAGKISEDGTDDRQWTITEAGKYIVTVDLANKNISIAKDTENGLNGISLKTEIASAGKNLFQVIGVEKAVIRVFNTQGALLRIIVSPKDEQLLDLSAQASGLYLIQISKTGFQSASHKVIVR